MSFDKTEDPAKAYNSARLVAGTLLTLTAVLALLVHSNSIIPANFAWIARYFTFWQDLPLLPLFLLALTASAKWAGLLKKVKLDGATIALIALILLLVTSAGRWLVFANYDLARDEQMANFDAAIFSHGVPFWPIDPQWRPFAVALNQIFILPVGDHEGWVSSYLPINAGIRAVVGLIASPSLASPLLVSIGALALWRISRRLWPDSGSTQWVVIACYCSSSQVLVTGMTAYAMSAHLALNLVWLMLFLRGGRAGHAGAIAAGFFATGIHQPIFHPLFVLPFLEMLRVQRHWKLLAAYVGCYLIIGIFWLAWPGWVSAHGAMPVPDQVNVEGVNFVQRFLRGTQSPTDVSLWLMAANLLRFAAWQHLLLLPLLFLGVKVASTRNPVAAALTGGLVLLVMMMTLILPCQGHGWGYRYLHGLIGSACLLAGYGWNWLEGNGYSLRRPMAIATAASLAILFPAHLVMAHALVAPFAAASREVKSSSADIVIVDNTMAPFAADVVLNRADLSNRPIILAGSAIDPVQMGELCRRGTIAFEDAPRLNAINRLFGFPEHAGASPHQRELQRAAARVRCKMTR